MPVGYDPLLPAAKKLMEGSVPGGDEASVIDPYLGDKTDQRKRGILTKDENEFDPEDTSTADVSAMMIPASMRSEQQLIPVESDPFAKAHDDQSLTPVEGDPFAAAAPTEVPHAFTDRILRGDALQRALGPVAGFAKGAKENFDATTPFGMSDETVQLWREHGIFADPATGRPGLIPREDEAAVKAIAVAGDAVLRTLHAGIGGVGGAVSSTAEKLGLPEPERLGRDIAGELERRMISGDVATHARLEPIDTVDKVRSQGIGTIPIAADFKTAAENLGGANTESNLRNLWETRGIHPAEAAHDAASDAFLKGDLKRPLEAGEKLPPEVMQDYLTQHPDQPPEEIEQPLRAVGAEVTAEQPSLTEQPPQPPGRIMAAVHDSIEKLYDVGKDAQMLVAPMATGTRESMAIAKDFANSMRRNRWEWSRYDSDIEKRFTPEQRKRMWDAADEESVSQQLGEKPRLSEIGIKLTGKNGVAKSGGDLLSFSVENDAVKLGIATVAKERRGQGIGRSLYEKVIDFATQRGLPVRSDISVSNDAIRVYKSLELRGYTVTEAPNTTTTELGKGNAKAGYVFEITDERPGTHMGLATLEPEERAAVEDMQSRSQAAWLRARDLDMVEGEGLPAYTPRMVLNLATATGKDTSLSLNAMGRNLRTRTAQMLQRKYLTAEETEAAAKAKLGPTAEIARDIRALPLATAKLEDAIAGRTLINNIKAYGDRTGEAVVVEGGEPAGSPDKWFTMQEHPAFQKWKPKFEKNPVTGKIEAAVDDAGNTIFERVPIYVRGDFEGPLRAVLSTRNGALYSGAMSLKGKTMSLIMNSPLIHNAVEWGRALPAMPGKVATFRIYFEGNHAKNDLPLMREAIDNGLVPIGKRFFNQDISSIMESPDLTPGRSWTAKLVGAVPGLFDAGAEAATKRAIDRMGDFWHNTLLWDRVGDLQMGLYKNFRDELIGRQVDNQTASRMAAHWANRFAGALPAEAMSANATKVANSLLFSRTFTMGNLGVMKDMLSGLPKDVLAQIERDAGELNPEAAGFAKAMARRRAMAVVTADILLMHVGNSILQSASNVMLLDRNMDDEWHRYVERFHAAVRARQEHPLKLLQPLALLDEISATAENEPGLQNRIKVGYAKDGTAIYARNPVGKIGEEFESVASGQLPDLIRRKLGTFARPAWQILANDKGFGRKLYDPNADSPDKYLQNAANIANAIFGAQVPEGQLRGFRDLVKGEGDPTIAALRSFGPITGVTFRTGYPGGPAVGEVAAAREQHQYKVDQALPDIRRQIIAGDVASARERMTELGIPRGLQNFYVRTSLNPASRLSGRTLRDFNRYATPEQIDRLERARSLPGPRAEPAPGGNPVMDILKGIAKGVAGALPQTPPESPTFTFGGQRG